MDVLTGNQGLCLEIIEKFIISIEKDLKLARERHHQGKDGDAQSYSMLIANYGTMLQGTRRLPRAKDHRNEQDREDRCISLAIWTRTSPTVTRAAHMTEKKRAPTMQVGRAANMNVNTPPSRLNSSTDHSTKEPRVHSSTRSPCRSHHLESKSPHCKHLGSEDRDYFVLPEYTLTPYYPEHWTLNRGSQSVDSLHSMTPLDSALYNFSYQGPSSFG